MNTILLVTLVLMGIIPAYSQINPNRKMETATEQSSANRNRNNGPFQKYKFVDKFPGSFNDARLSHDFLSPLQLLSKNTEDIYYGWSMPCFKPEGIFSMKVYKPDSSINYTMLLK